MRERLFRHWGSGPKLRFMCVAAMAAATAGCAAFPTQGPNAYAVTSEVPAVENARLGHVLIDLTPATMSVLEKIRPTARGEDFSKLRKIGAPELRLGIGDLVNITIFEAAAGGLFIPAEAGVRAGNFVTMPVQEVDRNGNIQIPYAGFVPANGRTLGEVKTIIEERLRNRAIEPQAVVTLQESRASLVTVTGDAAAPGRFPITRANDRLLDAITRAGGSKWPPYETYVTVQRRGRAGMVYFNRLVNEPASNIFVQPGDVISLSRLTRSFLALGATGQSGFINFESEELMLSQAVGRAGAVLDSRGDPAQTFLYRIENRRIVEKLGYDTSAFQGDTIPVIYRVNLRESQGFFLASKFPMEDRDILFVSNAQVVELTKVLQILSLAGNTVVDAEAARLIVGGR
jgi:polysaccharide export outer membrane protein